MSLDSTTRRQNTDGRRKRAGLTEVRIYLDPESHRAMNTLVDAVFANDDGKVPKNSRAEVKSKIIGHYLRKAEKAKVGTAPSDWIDLRRRIDLHRIQSIVQYVYDNEKGKKRNPLKETLKFMRESRFPCPAKVDFDAGRLDEPESDMKWRLKDIKELLKKPKISTNKKIPAKRKR